MSTYVVDLLRHEQSVLRRLDDTGTEDEGQIATPKADVRDFKCSRFHLSQDNRSATMRKLAGPSNKVATDSRWMYKINREVRSPRIHSGVLVRSSPVNCLLAEKPFQ